jgi:hypothetical protein
MAVLNIHFRAGFLFCKSSNIYSIIFIILRVFEDFLEHFHQKEMHMPVFVKIRKKKLFFQD